MRTNTYHNFVRHILKSVIVYEILVELLSDKLLQLIVSGLIVFFLKNK